MSEILNESTVLGTEICFDGNGNVDITKYQPDQLAKYKQLSTSINPSDSSSIQNFGSDAQNGLATMSNGVLSHVRNVDDSEFGGLVNDLLTQLNGCDIDKLDHNALQRFLLSIPLLKKLVLKTEGFFAKYDTIANNVDKIVNKLKSCRINSMKDNAMLDSLFKKDLENIANLSNYIIAGSVKYAELQETLKEMESNREKYQDYEVSDMRDFIERVDRRITDLKTIRLLNLQSLPSIRLIQKGNNQIADKSETLVNTTVPLWKEKLVIAVTLQRQKNNIKAITAATDFTETLIRKNAELLRQNVVDAQRESGRGIASLETCRAAQQSLIDAINEVKRLSEQQADERKVTCQGLETLETELKKIVRE